jgi:hypothetical protein
VLFRSVLALSALALLATIVFASVSIWRSAGRSNAGKLWRLLARFFSVFPLVYLFLGVALAIGIPYFYDYKGDSGQQTEQGSQAYNSQKRLSKPAEEALVNELTRASQEINSRGPVMVDDYTRLERAVAGPGPQITYIYTVLTGLMPNEAERMRVEKEVRYSVCTAENMEYGLSSGVSYNYHYVSPSEQGITSFSVQQHHCDKIFADPTLQTTGWTQESTGSTTFDDSGEPELPGTRYGRNIKGVVYRYFPPGARTDAEPANPFGLSESSSYAPR